MQLRLLTPSFHEKIWGTQRLEPWFPDSEKKIGEVWFEGVNDSPLLIKFVFSAEKLSVQVHPDDAYARMHHNSRGKTEMWHVLAAEPGAKIAAGFREPITVERLKAAALSGEIEQLLAWIDVAPGDTFFLPAGTVHALGGGLTLCEIQENSDITYRLYDYGRPRELHLDHALAVSNLLPHAVKRPPSGDVLVSCRHFTTKRLLVQGHTTCMPIPGQWQFLIAIQGEGRVGGQPIKAGQVCYIPEKAGPFEISGELRLLLTSAFS